MKRLMLAGLLCLFQTVALKALPLEGLGLRTNDVVAWVGSGTSVALAREGVLETLISGNRPDLHLRFRCLAWEGDTVFAQPREPNYPDLKEQLRAERATVVLVEFGLAESFEGPGRIPAFREALSSFLDGLRREGLRVVLLTPTADVGTRSSAVESYASAIRNLAGEKSVPVLDLNAGVEAARAPSGARIPSRIPSAPELAARAAAAIRRFDAQARIPDTDPGGRFRDRDWEALRAAVADRNRLWKQASRPTNWAFLAGDRTDQRFSRDPVDPSKRTFPEEMKRFPPLLEAADLAVVSLSQRLPTEWNTR